MGLFSSIKKGLSKAWKGIKKVVKKVAKGVKKVAKKIVTSTPWGKKLWELGSKAWKGIKKGIGKIASKLGPVGTMALSFVLAPVMGPALGAMWQGFGAGAASMAASANALVSTLGTVGQGIFATGNFIGGTLGAMGEAISQGASNVLSGNFSQAATSFASNMSSALTGEAGMAAVHAGNLAASTTAAADIAASGGSAAEVNALTESAAGSLESLQNMGQIGTETLAGMDPEVLSQASNTVDAMQQNIQNQMQATQMSSAGLTEGNTEWLDRISGAPEVGPMNPAQAPNFGDAMAMTSEAAVQTGVTPTPGIYQNTVNNLTAGNTAFEATATTSVAENVGKAKQNLDTVSSLLGGSQDGGYQPYVPQMVKSQAVGNVGTSQGQGSAGFSLLGGVRGLEQSVRRSQQMMFG